MPGLIPQNGQGLNPVEAVDEGIAAEVERLEQARREAAAEEARARAGAEAARAELAEEEARLAEVRAETARLEEVLRAQAHNQVALQRGTQTSTITKAQHGARAAGAPAATGRTCSIALWHGYRKAAFYARTDQHGEEVAIAESRMFRPHGNGIPDRTEEAADAYAALVEQLERDGWRRVATGSAWFEATFER
jgi:hypothetical protein